MLFIPPHVPVLPRVLSLPPSRCSVRLLPPSLPSCPVLFALFLLFSPVPALPSLLLPFLSPHCFSSHKPFCSTPQQQPHLSTLLPSCLSFFFPSSLTIASLLINPFAVVPPNNRLTSHPCFRPACPSPPFPPPPPSLPFP